MTVYYQRRMWAWRSAFALAISLGACSSPDSAPVGKSVLIPAPAAADVERPDAGPGQPLPAALTLGRPMLVDFTREDCLPCKLMEPWLAALRKRHAGRVEILELDLDHPENRDVARFFKARSVPMQVYVDARGREVSRNLGLATMQQMQDQLEKLGFMGGNGSQGRQGNHGGGR